MERARKRVRERERESERGKEREGEERAGVIEGIDRREREGKKEFKRSRKFKWQKREIERGKRDTDKEIY